MKRNAFFLMAALLLGGVVIAWLFLRSQQPETKLPATTAIDPPEPEQNLPPLSRLQPPSYTDLPASDPRNAYIAQDPILVLTGNTPDDLAGHAGVSLLIEQANTDPYIGVGLAAWPQGSRFATLTLDFPYQAGSENAPPKCDAILQMAGGAAQQQFFSGMLNCTFAEGSLKLEVALDPSTPYITFSPESARVSGVFAEENLALQPDGSLQIGERNFILTAHRLYPLRETALTGDFALPSYAQLDQIPLKHRLGMTANTQTEQQTLVAYFPHLSWRGLAKRP